MKSSGSSTQPTAIFNARVHAAERVIDPGLVLVEGGRIRAVGPAETIPLPTDTRLIDAERSRITPGIIDLVRFAQENDRPEAEGITAYVRAIPVHGPRSLQNVARAAASLAHKKSAARALGLHLLGPWLPGFGRPPDWREIWKAAKGAVRLVTLSSRAGATPQLASRLRAAGVRPIFLADDPLCESNPELAKAIRGLPARPPSSRAPLLFTPDDPPDLLARLRPSSHPNPVAITSSSQRNLTAAAPAAN